MVGGGFADPSSFSSSTIILNNYQTSIPTSAISFNTYQTSYGFQWQLVPNYSSWWRQPISPQPDSGRTVWGELKHRYWLWVQGLVVKPMFASTRVRLNYLWPRGFRFDRTGHLLQIPGLGCVRKKKLETTREFRRAVSTLLRATPA